MSVSVAPTVSTTRRHSRGAQPIAIVTDHALIQLGSIEPMAPPRSMLECFEIARSRCISQLWITPEAMRAIGIPEQISRRPGTHPFNEHGTLAISTGSNELSSWLSCWERNGHFLEISMPSLDRGSPFAHCTGLELLGELEEFRSATGMLWRRSGAITSDAWLREHWGRRLRPTEGIEASDDPLLEEHIDRHVLRPSAARARYLHAYDANAMYLGAASSLALPVGAISRLSTPDPLLAATMPGYWRVLEGHWVTSPTASLHWRNLPAELLDAYGWHDHHRFLEPWYRMLRDARTHLLPYGGPALEAVKQVYRQGIGRLGSARRTISDDPLYQPYWRQAVQAEARCRLERRIATLKQPPAAVGNVDGLYFLTSVEDPIAFAERILLPIGTGIGQFKHSGTIAGRDAREILQGESSLKVVADLRIALQGR